MSWLIDLIQVLFSGWLKSKETTAESLGKAEAKDEMLTNEIKTLQKEAEAVANAPTDRASLIQALKNGRVCVLFLAAMFLSSCATNPPSACPALKNWTQAQESQIADSLTELPSNSPLIGALIEWAQLRASARACAGNNFISF